ncbi:bifunctional 2-keto-4-hydroxyglutarate aldolase/2-keto-3-deoxy-6-phosphogluconate aldolase [Vagococcus fessus]|uniref:2-dehydro-3-deoxyphosphogluconate aldolase n=1 Tax=Vagococcus fessus TaxID=120370 RepID=A0A430A680_9ENTE|nr:bifunctional 2-keto-4-hydroxyglutarate aldolase/2-keto-3-deoxy-6-phosphogluconate aldolase [Vagococcus fessus]RSU02383.1 2-dehydro-3-deoxyphosphogluconate aldolase [Vagococcus fessus]
MTKKSRILDQLASNYLFAVVRGKNITDGVKISEACCEGGLKNIEVTYTTPQAGEVIRQVTESMTDKEVVIGAGTVLDDITARDAILSGAKFVVSPHFDAKISKVCNRYAVPYLPGCGSVTEIIQAMENGSDVVKLFPGGLLGASYIKDVHGPIPDVEMMPSGGVSIDNLDQWIGNGAWGVGVGSALTRNVATDGYESVTVEAKKFVDKVSAIKEA